MSFTLRRLLARKGALLAKALAEAGLSGHGRSWIKRLRDFAPVGSPRRERLEKKIKGLRKPRLNKGLGLIEMAALNHEALMQLRVLRQPVEASRPEPVEPEVGGPCAVV